MAVLRGAIGTERLLMARYRPVLAADPGLRGILDPVLGQHLAHLAALRSRLIGPAATPRPRLPSPPRPAGPASSRRWPPPNRPQQTR